MSYNLLYFKYLATKSYRLTAYRTDSEADSKANPDSESISMSRFMNVTVPGLMGNI